MSFNNRRGDYSETTQGRDSSFDFLIEILCYIERSISESTLGEIQQHGIEKTESFDYSIKDERFSSQKQPILVKRLVLESLREGHAQYQASRVVRGPNQINVMIIGSSDYQQKNIPEFHKKFSHPISDRNTTVENLIEEIFGSAQR